MKKIKIVEIPACEQHQGLYSIKIKLFWTCPKCGAPRGEVKNGRSYDGSCVLICDTWQNPCGHIDKYCDVKKEALTNGLNEGAL